MDTGIILVEEPITRERLREIASQNNRTRSIEDAQLRAKILEIVSRLVQ